MPCTRKAISLRYIATGEGCVRCQIGNEDIGVAITSIIVYDEQDLLLQKTLSL